MENFNKYCHLHKNKLLNRICIAPYDQKRKYCLLCQFLHPASSNQFISSFEFQEKYINEVKKKIEQYKKSNQSNIKKFVSIKKNIESEIERIQKKLDQLKKYFINLEITLSIYDNLLQRYLDPEEFSSSDLNKIMELKDGKELNNFDLQQKSLLIQLNKIQSCLVENIKTFNNNLNEDLKQHLSRKQYEGKLWNDIQKRFTQIQFEILYISGQKIKYLGNDGQTLRIQKTVGLSNQTEILTNYEQIKYLQWDGDYGEDMRRNGKWTAFWNKQVLSNVGERVVDGMCKKFFQAFVFEIGEYKNDFRIGNWSYEFENQRIKGGSYNIYSEKNGKWMELSEGFYFYSQISYVGEYQNNKKVGIWETWYKNHVKDSKNQQIGGGSYFNNIKCGKWIELNVGFYEYSQVTFNGEYKIGKKIGKWDIWYKKRVDQQNQLIGGGSYNARGDGMKIGYWVELADGFYEDSQVINNGEYKNGKKVGRWVMLYRKGEGDQWNQQVGGGLYSDDIKIGQWIEISDGFRNISKVTYKGEYEYGRKVGKWDIWYMKYEGDQKNEQIGGGSYEKEGEGNKIGYWVEISDGFYEYSQVTYCGDYRIGRKVGKWDIWYRKHDEDQRNKQMGGGHFEDGIKIGKWIELSEKFRKIQQVIFQGDYALGQKVGKWDILYNEEEKFKKIGGGSYDNGIKISKWIELSEAFGDYSQVMYKGEYKQGQKLGIWDIWYRRYIDEPYKLIGGGSYDQFFNGYKIGYWVELSEGFKDYSQVTYKGNYKDNKKVGRWDISYRYNVKLPFQQIGGGSYDKGIKIGKWIDLCDDFKDLNQIIYIGEYKDGKKEEK
ncbi:unnamed protein product [Paramecium primaurelia]|uniref:Uncharacterized protein n=1 Tax=Paramecium primaurelia TaxID=5886 RepID=A0A8S1NWT9_PARPR|nr:unnamed protein product [Paramecium primaurelia]